MKGRVPPIINMEKIEMMKENVVTLAHGAGGKQTNELIDQVFKRHFSNPDLTADDAAVLSLSGKGKIAFTHGQKIGHFVTDGGGGEVHLPHRRLGRKNSRKNGRAA